MADYENQHFVPVFYTQRWANVRGQVTRYFFDQNVRRADNFKCVETGPRPLGRKRHLWTVHGSLTPNHKYLIEREFFGQIDDKAARIADRFVNGRNDLTDKERVEWAQFLVSLRYRNPIIVQYEIKRVANLIRANETFPPATPKYEKFLDGFIEPAYLTSQVSLAKNIEVFARYRRYSIRRLKGHAFTFLTCDWPLLKFYSAVNRAHGETWILPLSPTVVMIATPSTGDTDYWEWLGENRLVREVNAAVTKSFMQDVWACDQTQSTYVERRMKLRGPANPEALMELAANARP